MKILIDNGHGFNTDGKHSPDNPPSLYEWKYCREIAAEVVARLKAKGHDAELLTPEEADISLTQRCARANAWCDTLGASKVVLVSIHNNATGADGKWHTARGFSAWISRSASAKSKELAQILHREALARGLAGNRCQQPDLYWEANFTITTRTKCPAVLTENLFQDNREDVDLLLSPEGREAITALHVAAIEKYCAKYGK